MTAFSVKPASVVAMSRLTGRAGDDAKAMEKVVAGGPHGFGQEGVFLSIVADTVSYWQQRASDDTKKAAGLLAAAATQLNTSATAYQHTDQANSAKLDATLSQGYYRPLTSHDVKDAASASNYQDITDPTKARTDPASPSDASLAGADWPYKTEQAASSLTSIADVSTYLRQVSKALFGVDIFQEISIHVAGDWKSFGHQAIAFRMASAAFKDINTNLKRGQYAIHADWTGNAADQFQGWMQDFEGCVDIHADFLDKASHGMLDYAAAAYNGFCAIEGLINEVIDFLCTLALGPVSEVGFPIIAGVEGWAEGADLSSAVVSVALAVSKINDAISIVTSAAHAVVALGEEMNGEQALLTPTWPDKFIPV